MKINELDLAEQLAMVMDRIYHYGITTTSGGNLSIRDNNGNVWITPAGIDKGTLTKDDMICIKPDGSFAGKHKPSCEYPFHLNMYKKRPDIKAIIHAHPPALVAFSLVNKIPDVNLITGISRECGKIAMAGYAIPGSIALGEIVSDEFEKGCDMAIMANHGVVAGSKTNLSDAFKMIEALDFCAKLEVNASIIGMPRGIQRKEFRDEFDQEYCKYKEVKSGCYYSEEVKLRSKLCAFASRAYDQRIFSSVQGSISARIDGNRFIITPSGKDNKYLEYEDIVRIDKNTREAGKIPSRSVDLHKEIYAKNPEVNTVMTAQPPYAMAFAVTDVALDSRIIPESYISMQEIAKFDAGTIYEKPEEIAGMFQKDTPVALVKNNCIISTGTDLMNAFDRMEVAEYSARALVASKHIGKVVSISDKDIEDIKLAFHLV
jgi:L-fuculose-phosphate aldolase